MELNDTTNLKTLTQSLSFKPLSSMQTSFVSELEFSLGAAPDESIVSEEKSFVDVKKEEPIAKNEKKAKVENDKAKEKDSSISEQIKSEDKKEVDTKDNLKNMEQANKGVEVSAQDVANGEKAIVTGDGLVKEFVEEASVNFESEVEIDDNAFEAPEGVDNKEAKVNAQNAVPVGQNFNITAEDLSDLEAVKSSLVEENPINAKAIEKVESFLNPSTTEQVVLQESSKALGAADVLAMPEEVEAQKISTDAIVADLTTDSWQEAELIAKPKEQIDQENALAEKLSADKKISIETKVEEAGFDFSKPKVVAAEPVKNTSEKVDGVAKEPLVSNVMQKPQSTYVDVAKVGVAVQQNASSQASEVASKAVQNNINPIGLEVSNKVSKFNEVASSQKTSGNDNLRAMSKEVIEQIKINITKSAIKGVDVIDISLKPEDLGELSIKIELKKEDGSVEINIAASNKETLELLQKDAANLQKAFEDAGYKMGENSLSFSEQEQSNKENSQKQARIEFMADALSEPAQEETIYEGNMALNIKV